MREQESTDLADKIRKVPDRALARVAEISDHALRSRPAPGEWSAIEVVGHLVDKFDVWRERVERTSAEESPALAPYDQDELVRRGDYQAAHLASLIESLRAAARRFAGVVESLEGDAFERPCRHGEYGEITLRQCITLPLESVDDHFEQIDRALRTSGSGTSAR